MTDLLGHRLELAAGADLAIDHALLDWLADGVGLGRTVRWLAHVRELTGDLGAAFRILEEVFPDASYSLTRGNGGLHNVMLVPTGESRPFSAAGQHPANALFAAILRAHAALGLARPAASDWQVSA